MVTCLTTQKDAELNDHVTQSLRVLIHDAYFLFRAEATGLLKAPAAECIFLPQQAQMFCTLTLYLKTLKLYCILK